jgi:hypothetical protein
VPASSASPKLDSAAAKAIDLAREAAELEGSVGEHLGVRADDERVVTHLFACTDPAYVGWHWAVTLARASRAKTITIDEVVLLPGDGAIIAPPWVPWSERVQPGDLVVGVVWPTAVDDPRLIAGFSGADDLEGLASRAPLHPSQWELGLGRSRVLSVDGWEGAAHRWHHGEFGPDSAMARSVEMSCATCGFLITMGGPLGQAFGVCAQEMSPADGRVVALDFGCGAHSEITEEPGTPAVGIPVTDELAYDSLDLGHS